jgi:hypothetical protein
MLLYIISIAESQPLKTNKNDDTKTSRYDYC